MNPRGADPLLDDIEQDVRHLLARASRYTENAATVWSWAHPSWRAHAFGLVPAFPEAAEVAIEPITRAGQRRVLAGLMLARLGIVTPTLEALVGTGEAIALLPPRDALRACRIRALSERADEVRRTITRAGLQFIDDCVGDCADTFAVIMRSLGGRSGPPAQAAVSPLAAHDADLLAWEGLQLLRREGMLSADGASGLLRLALPRELPPYSESVQPDPVAAQVFSASLAHLFPEHAWLFG